MATQMLKCERHGAQTRLTCVDCGKPICPKCSVRTEVGLKCEEHARSGVEIQIPGRRSRFLLPGVAVLVGLAILAAVVVFRPKPAAPPPRPEPAGTWESMPDLASIRGTTIAAALGEGRVLVAGGGVQRQVLGAAEIFDATAGTWTKTGDLNDSRRGHQAVVLADGRVLVSGGIGEEDLLASTEIFDPATGRWARTGAMAKPRLGHSLTLLRDGRVLAIGGSTPDGAPGDCGGQSPRPDSSTEFFDPEAGTWAPGPAMDNTRFEHTATLLDDGRVLVAGGLGGAAGGSGDLKPLVTAEQFDPAAGIFTRSSPLSEGRTNHAAVKLPDGSVLVAGGSGGADCDISLASAELYDGRRGGWSLVEAMAQARTGLTATALADGKVVAAAGESVSRGTRRSLDTADLFDPATRKWRPAGEKMNCPRSEQAAALLPDGTVLVVAGDVAFPGQAPQASSCAERYRL